MEQEHLTSVLESLLFVSAKPLTPKALAKILEAEETRIAAALAELAENRKDSGVVVLENNGEYQMATQPKNSTAVKNFLNAELREKLTDATVEVLAIITYRQPISKAEIEAIRGVNSQYSLRALLMRGLVEKIPNPNDARGFLYQTTTEFLMHLGLNSTKDLPEFEKLVAQIKLPETPAVQESEAVPSAAQAPAVFTPSETDAAQKIPPQTDEKIPASPGVSATTETDEIAEEESDDDDEEEDDDEDDE